MGFAILGILVGSLFVIIGVRIYRLGRKHDRWDSDHQRFVRRGEESEEK